MPMHAETMDQSSKGLLKKDASKTALYVAFIRHGHQGALFTHWVRPDCPGFPIWFMGESLRLRGFILRQLLQLVKLIWEMLGYAQSWRLYGQDKKIQCQAALVSSLVFL